jgi:hypothetical protein
LRRGPSVGWVSGRMDSLCPRAGPGWRLGGQAWPRTAVMLGAPMSVEPRWSGRRAGDAWNGRIIGCRDGHVRPAARAGQPRARQMGDLTTDASVARPDCWPCRGRPQARRSNHSRGGDPWVWPHWTIIVQRYGGAPGMIRTERHAEPLVSTHRHAPPPKQHADNGAPSEHHAPTSWKIAARAGKQPRPQPASSLVTALIAGAPEGTRTPNLLIRSQMLYPLSYGRSVPSQLTHRFDTRRLRDSNPGGALKPQPH